jgi:hypothetical protein
MLKAVSALTRYPPISVKVINYEDREPKSDQADNVPKRAVSGHS